jgi:hypothetical protein
VANTQGMCTDFKKQMLNGIHAFGTTNIRGGTGADTFNLALFRSDATRNNTDTVYNNTGELASSGGYTQTGLPVTNATPPATSGTTAYWTPSASVTWTNLTSSFEFDCAVLYNATTAAKSEVSVHTFTAQTIVAADFTLTMPTNDATTGLIRVA